MESGERVRLVLFFQGLRVLLDHFFDGTQGFVDGWCSRLGSHFCSRGRHCLDHFSDRWRSGGSQLGLTLAATHFTWIVRCATVFGEDDRRSFGHWFNHFGGCRCFDGSGLGNYDRLGNHFRHYFGNYWLGNYRLSGYWLGDPVERGLLFANFRRFFNDWRFNGRLCSNNRRFSHFCDLWLCFDHWSNLYRWRFRSFDWRGGFNDRCFNLSSFLHSFFSNGSGCTFSLLMGLGFGWRTDHTAGHSGSYRETGSQFSASRLFVAFGLFRAFDHVAVGIALTLAAVAATTLATGAAAWTIAFGAVLTVFGQLLFVAWQFFFGNSGGSLFGTWLALFTRWAWCAFFTRLASWTLFSSSDRGGGSGSSNGWCSVQRLAQFTYRTFFTLATWLAIFTRRTW